MATKLGEKKKYWHELRSITRCFTYSVGTSSLAVNIDYSISELNFIANRQLLGKLRSGQKQ
jgi:hypothetical protein